MKVLFAVSSENISEAIIKRYQKEYKEILSYKNVYYFNAILKEIQKDKTYDRIVISEDLEPFSNNNYETIDKFIFEKLDSIGDEAQDSNGKETSIILICTDRRQKGNSILVKLFGIGVYNALLGNDRSMEEVCKLINRPRTKKEAKIYYRIDAEDVNYKAENENEVSEVEIQNILAHFKKLGKNTAKYTDSFNNIAVQYNDQQLKIIVNCLPINVKAVLESNCEKYQELMAVTGGISSVKNLVANTGNNEESLKKEISSKSIGKAGNITKPIVIPSAVRNAKNQSQVQKATVQPTVTQNVQTSKVQSVQRPVIKTVQAKPTPQVKQQSELEDVLLPGFEEEKEEKEESVANPVRTQTTGFQRQRRPVPGMSRTIQSAQPQVTLQPENIAKPEIEEAIENSEVTVDDPNSKRGRGRPRKTPVEGVIAKPKGKRGRPRKNQEEVFDEESNSTMLPGMEDDFVYEEPAEENTMLPGFEDDEIIEEENSMLPGIEEEPEEYSDGEATLLPGMGFEDETDYGDEEYSDDKIVDEDFSDEVTLNGLDGLDDFEDINTTSEVYEETENMLPGFEEEQYQEDDSDDLLPGISSDYEDDSADNQNIEESLLPGMEAAAEEQEIIQPSFSRNSNVVESIKPKVDYSMSSLNSLITKDKKIVTFIGTSKNGVSFLVNNLAALFSSLGINTAVLDMTQNKNSYYIYTKNEDELRNIAFNSIEKLQNGYTEGIKVDKNLSIYTALPNDGKDYSNAEPILSTLVQNHSLILIDCDYYTDLTYFASCQEMYLVQSMDILTIQPLTAFLRELKTKGILEPEKIRVVVNKELKVKSLSVKAIIGGLSYYNDPAMSFITELFNKDMVKACTIPFEDNAYSKYLEGIVNCNISLKGFSKVFLSKLKVLGDMVYPLTSKQTYGKGQVSNYNQNAFSNSMNDTLNKMRKKI